VALTNMTTSGAAEGIYIVWVQGQAGSPYLTTKHEPFAVKIGTVTRDFTITSDASSKDAANVGDTVSFTLTLQNSPNKNTAFGNAVTLSVDGPLPAGAGPVTFGSTSSRRARTARTRRSASTPAPWPRARTASSSGRPA